MASVTTADSLAGWTIDGRFLLLYRATEFPPHLDRMDISNGRREPFLRIDPQDKVGLTSWGPIVLSADQKTYAYGLRHYTSQLYLVQGAR